MAPERGFGYFLTVVTLASAALACDLPTNAALQADALGATQTMQALATEVVLTLHADTDSEGEAETEAEVDDSLAVEASVTPTLTLTPTLGVPMVRVSVDTNCRFGPGNVYEYQGALLVGEEARITGKLADESFWYIENPDPPPPHCWIWGAYAQITGDTSGLPVLTPPPTPTETPIPMDFSVTLDTAFNCLGIWGVFLRVENTGAVDFSSVRVTLTDSDLGETEIDDADWFPNTKACAIVSPPSRLTPGAGAYIAAFGFSANPTGHDVSATVRMCAQDGLGGECVQKNVSGNVPSP